MLDTLDYIKLRGGYYTPKAIADFLTKWAIRSPHDSVLEPSSGDGIFIESAIDRLRFLGPNSNKVDKQILAVELDPEEADKIIEKIQNKSVDNPASMVRNDDFFSIAKNELIGKCLFDVIVGNPPFIRYQNFIEESRDMALQMMKDIGLNPNKLTNIWVPFLVLSIQLLKRGGRLAMVIPAELFQVNYAGETRKFLTDSFSNITIITFEKLVFKGIQQEIVLILGEKNGDSASTIKTIEMENINDLSSLDSDLISLNMDNNPALESKLMTHSEEKWTYYFLDREEIQFLRSIKKRYHIPTAKEFLDVDVGLCTGQNEFFVLSPTEVLKRGLESNVIRIITRSAHLKGITLVPRDWDENIQCDYPMFLFMPPEDDINQLDSNIKDYIKYGETNSFNKGYKCRIRQRWYNVPSVWVPDAFMLRQVHSYPKIVLNEVGATCTDTVHRIKIRDGVDGHQIAVAFLNSLTFVFSELMGRSYGGGVLTFEPSECEKIPIPFNSIDRQNFARIDELIRQNKIDDALDINDRILLVENLGLSLGEAKILRRIWKKLRDRRINRKH